MQEPLIQPVTVKGKEQILWKNGQDWTTNFQSDPEYLSRLWLQEFAKNLTTYLQDIHRYKDKKHVKYANELLQCIRGAQDQEPLELTSVYSKLREFKTRIKQEGLWNSEKSYLYKLCQIASEREREYQEQEKMAIEIRRQNTQLDTEHQQQLRQLRQQAVDYQAQLNQKECEINQLTIANQLLENRVQILTDVNESLMAKNDGDKRSQDEAFATLQAINQRLQEECDIVNKNMENVCKDNNNKREKIETLHNENDTLKETKKTQDEKITSLTKRNDQLSEENETLDGQLRDQKNLTESLAKKNKELETNVTSLKTDLNDLKEEYNELKTDHDEGEKKFNAHITNFNALITWLASVFGDNLEAINHFTQKQNSLLKAAIMAVRKSLPFKAAQDEKGEEDTKSEDSLTQIDNNQTQQPILNPSPTSDEKKFFNVTGQEEGEEDTKSEDNLTQIDNNQTQQPILNPSPASDKKKIFNETGQNASQTLTVMNRSGFLSNVTEAGERINSKIAANIKDLGEPLGSQAKKVTSFFQNFF
jgi:myosin heavy subunit